MHRSRPLPNPFTATLNTLWMCAYPDCKPESRVRGLVYPDLGLQTQSPVKITTSNLHLPFSRSTHRHSYTPRSSTTRVRSQIRCPPPSHFAQDFARQGLVPPLTECVSEQLLHPSDDHLERAANYGTPSRHHPSLGLPRLPRTLLLQQRLAITSVTH